MSDARTMDRVHAGLARRYRAERRFRAYGIAAVGSALGVLALLFGSILWNGVGAFTQTFVALDVSLDADELDPEGTGDRTTLAAADYGGAVKAALREAFPTVAARGERRLLYSLVSDGADLEIRNRVLEDPSRVGTTSRFWVSVKSDVDLVVKGSVDREAAVASGRLDERQLAWVDELVAAGRVDRRFAWTFLTAGDSRDPEQAGIWGAAVGSFYTLLVTLVLSFPIGVGAAVYLEEFAPKNRWTDLIEININNLAAVPSIVFGLLGLAVFLNFFGLPRSAPLVGGLVLALMTLPTIIIAGRAALLSVPPSIREAALGVGASRVQVVWHHVVPLAMPGMLTGTILGMAQALGQSAPLLMIGMVAFIVDVPRGVFDASTVLPVQIFLWADSPERGFVERTSAAILVLLAFLVVMNSFAVVLRRQFERRW